MVNVWTHLQKQNNSRTSNDSNSEFHGLTQQEQHAKAEGEAWCGAGGGGVVNSKRKIYGPTAPTNYEKQPQTRISFPKSPHS